MNLRQRFERLFEKPQDKEAREKRIAVLSRKINRLDILFSGPMSDEGRQQIIIKVREHEQELRKLGEKVRPMSLGSAMAHYRN